ncbi:1-(5-phosphoribosyl)-5-[(5-phosphoribosylamino)methylideneamino]imidazole-4-carboxamide isomerase [Helicobacter sp. 13S00477-4]|uniref:1-(5-phosphoribosyl)-5-[(5- phosphoribosylamino)methylideneamino]imidazole-4- carboxamide isomerase n=1 Tax=Helicobacter sp. 13S00477-4 TaxID=1905759 RepID=UPI000BA60BD0|nr:1-(5-phosphoribosyl)-5-[(5-phosphoribosylamino)methylideneamino]imidazole-4-carboxamide isomerase [Helicobacter sp. 13S00477-4]PAF50485.1 1-(5-phosphoribosyl)-5-[(5-phosphoribosylamino)methylideneamino]imidazole-4-carboxamide isomerase [Helicobacter sp. 13S00477-4]
MLEIFPAIDLKEGQVVRLYKGKMSSAKVYGSPIDFAKKFENMGSKWIHIVDLDGAFCGEPKNLGVIHKIRESTNLKIQLGGGIRSEENIKNYIEIGIDRLILGSVAMKNPDFVEKMALRYPIAVGIDAKDGKVAIEGWAHTEQLEATHLAKRFKNTGIEAVICTDISRDGAFEGINVDWTLSIAKASECFCIASGGFRDENDLIILDEAFKENKVIGGVIIGKAYYEDKIDLKSILKRFL